MKMFWSVIVSILSFYAILVLVNIPAPFLGLEFDSGEQPDLWYALPGYIIPLAWFVLFTLLGIARYLLVRNALPDRQWWLYGLAFLSAMYAYYTLGLAKLTGISALWFGLAGNLLVILFATLVVFKLLSVNRPAAFLTLPVIVWTLYASLIVLGEMKQQKLI